MTEPTKVPDNENALEIDRLRFALDAAGVGTWDYDLQTGQVQWSDICKQLFGLPADTEVTAAILLEQVHPDDRERVRLANAWSLNPAGNGEHNTTFRTLNPECTLRWLQAKGRTIKGDQGQPIRFSGIVQDVTQAIVTQQQIEQVQRQILSSFEQSPVAIAIITNPSLTIRIANSFYGQLVNRAPDQLIGKSFQEALPDISEQGFVELMEQVIATNTPYTAREVAVVVGPQREANTIYVDLTYQPWQEAGQTTGVLVVATDVTQQVLARQELATERNQLDTILSEVPIGILIANPKGELIYGNRRVEQIFRQPLPLSRSMETYKNLPLFDPLTSQPFPLEALPMMRTLLSGETVVGVEMKLKRGDDTWGFVNINTVPVYDGQGKLLYGVAAFEDITERKKSEQALQESESRYRELARELETRVRKRTQELEQANQDLQRSNDNLQQFAYVASHDLQEPLRKIQQFGDLLDSQYGEQLGQGADFLKRMQAAASRMSTLIRDLLAYSRVTTRQQTFGPIALQTILNNVLVNLEWSIAQSCAQVDFTELPVVKGDATQLGQLFQNLLSNAIKFTKPGETPSIQVSSTTCTRSDIPDGVRLTSDATNFYQISVHDEGIGFDTKYLDRIFQVFQRLHKKSDYAGSGVGLAICQRVVENHGGGITATSRPGEGATFLVYLPA